MIRGMKTQTEEDCKVEESFIDMCGQLVSALKWWG